MKRRKEEKKKREKEKKRKREKEKKRKREKEKKRKKITYGPNDTMRCLGLRCFFSWFAAHCGCGMEIGMEVGGVGGVVVVVKEGEWEGGGGIVVVDGGGGEWMSWH